ncbi:MAG: TIM barrel protein [Planctomycetota bacterium]
MTPPLLAYAFDSLPGAPRERWELARRLGLAVEPADRPETDLALAPPDVPLPTLQAFGMHELHPLHADAEARRGALPYVLGVLGRAASAGIPRVLTASGFRPAVADRAVERCLDFYAALAPRARELGVRVLIEPLSPKRAGALTDPAAVAGLLRELDQPDVFGAALDTGHLLDAGLDPARIVGGWDSPVEELQLRGPRGAPPPVDARTLAWLHAPTREPAVVAVEHRQPINVVALERLVELLRGRMEPGRGD